jgi:hypothetical protein
MNTAIESRIQVVDNHYTACKTYIDRLQRLHGDIAVQQELAAVVRDQVRTFAHVLQVLIATHRQANQPLPQPLTNSIPLELTTTS